MSIADHARLLGVEMSSFGPAVPDLLAAWLHHREPMLDGAGPDDEVHVALLERHAAGRADDPAVLLDRADRAARACGDEVARLRVEAERLSLLGDDDPDRMSRLVEIAEHLDSLGSHRDAGAVWRTAAHLAASPDEGERLSLACARASRDDGDRPREGLALVEAARWASGAPDRAADHLAQARPLVDGHPALLLMADDTEARLLAAAGRPDEAVDLLEAALDAEHPPAFEMPSLLLLCDLLTDAHRIEELLDVSDRVLDDAVAARDPLSLALGQRFHGLALVETGHPAEGLDLLDAALPVIADNLPQLLGPVRWAHANALTLLGEPGPARRSYAAAATSFEAAGRLHEAAHAQLQAGHRAWDCDDLEAAEAHFDSAAGFADGQQDPLLLIEAARGRASVRHQAGVVDDLAELDAVLDDVRRRMTSWGVDESGLDLAAASAKILRSGALMLADHGRFEEAAARMQAAEEVWPSEEEAWMLRAERGVFLAQAGQFDQAEALVREALSRLSGDGWTEARQRFVMQWVSALDRAGRSEDANRIWDELGSGQ